MIGMEKIQIRDRKNSDPGSWYTHPRSATLLKIMFFLVENDVTDEERDREMAMALQKQLYYQDAKQQV